MSYEDLVKKHEAEFNSFSKDNIFWLFGSKEQALNKLAEAGLTVDDVVNIYAGGYLRKTKIAEYEALVDKHEKEKHEYLLNNVYEVVLYYLWNYEAEISLSYSYHDIIYKLVGLSEQEVEENKVDVAKAIADYREEFYKLNQVLLMGNELKQVKIHEDVKAELDLLKYFENDSYSTVIKRLIEENKQLKEDKIKLYKIVLATEDSPALINPVHKAVYFMANVIEDSTADENEKLNVMETYLSEMIVEDSAAVLDGIDILKDGAEDEVVISILSKFENYVRTG